MDHARVTKCEYDESIVGGRVSHDKEVPCRDNQLNMLGNHINRDAQVKMFFSSGTAHTNGGGSFCMVTYSFVS